MMEMEGTGVKSRAERRLYLLIFFPFSHYISNKISTVILFGTEFG